MECINQKCDATEIESDDNFCYKCGHWTARGYSFLNKKENIDMISKGATVKQKTRLSIMGVLLALLFIVFSVMLMIRGSALFKPFAYLKKQMLNYSYGYNTSLMKTDNKYSRESINTYEEAIEFIKQDFNKQDFYCFNKPDVDFIEIDIEKKYSIPSVSFCDMSVEETEKVENVIDKVYALFPNIQGALTNITITNAMSKSEYIARFQSMYQFVNINEDIISYNKVNKTQILLNSYYFLNEDIMNSSVESIVGDNWYVNDATWESTIAHEFGHYISFLTLLRKNGIDNITFVTSNNIDKINSILEEFNSGTYSTDIVMEALNNYNTKYNKSLSLEEFAKSISRYASTKNDDGVLIADETIAEAIHDYFLHGNDMKLSSKEIVSVIKSRL